MDVVHVYALLREACALLDQAGESAIAAHVSHCMALVRARYDVGQDHLDSDD